MNFKISELQDNDWSAVSQIYVAGIASGNATFETVPPQLVQWDLSHLPHSRWVAEVGHQVIGWIALLRYLISAFIKSLLKSVFTFRRLVKAKE